MDFSGAALRGIALSKPRWSTEASKATALPDRISRKQFVEKTPAPFMVKALFQRIIKVPKIRNMMGVASVISLKRLNDLPVSRVD
jgi:hypothetical protein